MNLHKLEQVGAHAYRNTHLIIMNDDDCDYDDGNDDKDNYHDADDDAYDYYKDGVMNGNDDQR